MSPKQRRKVSAFDELVLNAIDFAKRSVTELRRSPKYSMIHFAAAVELFLKARLLHEHWSLVIARPETASLISFRSGDFQSVSLDEAIKRLRNVANEPISDGAQKAFRAVRDHRNRLVHFFHPVLGSRAKAPKLEEVVSDQYKAWHFLNELVTGAWQNHFRAHARGLQRLNKTMLRLREFLKAKYEALLPEIEDLTKNGAIFEICFFCRFPAAKVETASEPLFSGKCLVCHSSRESLHVPCPECGETIVVEDLGEGTCKECGEEIDINYLLEQYGPATDPKEDPETAYCSNCERTDTQTVIPAGMAISACHVSRKRTLRVFAAIAPNGSPTLTPLIHMSLDACFAPAPQAMIRANENWAVMRQVQIREFTLDCLKRPSLSMNDPISVERLSGIFKPAENYVSNTQAFRRQLDLPSSGKDLRRWIVVSALCNSAIVGTFGSRLGQRVRRLLCVRGRELLLCGYIRRIQE